MGNANLNECPCFINKAIEIIVLALVILVVRNLKYNKNSRDKEQIKEKWGNE